MKFDLTMKELLEIIQNQLDGLKGKNVVKEGGIAKLVEGIINEIQIEGSSLTRYNVYIDHCLLKMYCPEIDEDIEFAVVRQTYKSDKRRYDGYGDVLESASIELKKEIPLDMKVLDVSQFLDYEEAKECFERLEKESRELLEQHKRNLEGMSKMQNIMKYQAYNMEATRESEKAEEILNSFRI